MVCDRFADSMMAYQGYAGGVDLDRLAALYRLVAGDFTPDLTLILDLPAATGLARAKARSSNGEDRFECIGAGFHERLRAGFLEIAKAEPERCGVIDATAGIDAVHAACRTAVKERLGAPL